MARRRGESLTLKTVASRLGVSTATVSNAFNRPTQLSQELREEILFACRQLKYAGPKAEARQRRAKKTKIVALVLSGTTYYGLDEPYLRAIVSGISNVFEHYNYNLLVVPPTQKPSNLSDIESFIEGFIICGDIEPTLLNRLREHKKTIIAVNTFIENCITINIDNKLAAFHIAEHAFLHKPASVAVIGIGLSEKQTTTNLRMSPIKRCGNSIMLKRLEGFREAASKSGITISDQSIWSIPKNTHFYGFETAKYILSQASKPDLILGMSDQIALSALDARGKLSLCESDTMLITGFDGCYENNPTLTTIELPLKDMGRYSAEIFLGLRQEANMILDANLRIGMTTP